MTTRTQSLAGFLLARIAEDEVKARHRDEVTFGPERRRIADESRFDPHDPARVLAECEAKRRIVERFNLLAEGGDGHEAMYRRSEMVGVLRALALPYADHPEFRSEWRP